VKILCVGKNYTEHAAEMAGLGGGEAPAERLTHFRAQRTLTPAASAAAASVQLCSTTRRANTCRPLQLSAALR
jgi:2-keto-4-pentenoate hydratase/2-oxohepta-3-ene-1,7-dioic acid hydratase in catechol pathway